MKAAVFHKTKKITFDEVPDPKIEKSEDILLRVTSTAICGSDLHIYNGYIPQLHSMVLGHEFMGIVEEVGSSVTRLKKGDRVVVPFPIACGKCFACERHVPTGCENSNPNGGIRSGEATEKGAALFGYTDLYGAYSGGQAELVRVPYANFGPRKVPQQLSDEEVLFLSDIFPTGYAGVDWAGVKKGDTVVVFGCGPVGLMAQKAAWIRGAKRVIGVDRLKYRLSRAVETCHSEVINADEVDPVEAIIEMTNGHGADVVIDAVGMEADRNPLEKISDALHRQAGTIKVINQAFTCVRRGGAISILGVYGTKYDNFPLAQWQDKGVQVKAGQAPVQNYIDELLMLIESGKIKLDDIISHRMPLSQVSKAYEIFNNKEDQCVKVVLKP